MVYLIEFLKPIGTERHTARTYIGYCHDKRYGTRLHEHMTGRGAALTRWAYRHNIPWHVARTWPGEDRAFERKLKNQKNARRLLPARPTHRRPLAKRQAAPVAPVASSAAKG